jgi:3-oxoacyl-[acyl-carrier protein] reductase
MLLESKTAIVYGGGGAIGGAVARAFAREGATVHLAGRTLSRLQKVADDIRADGGRAETAEIDAFDEAAVREHAEAVVAGGGSLDVSVNLIWHPDHFGKPITEMRYEDFEQDVTRRLRTMWITAGVAVPHMVAQGSGVILTFGGDGPPTPNLGGLQVAFGAVEALRRTLAAELGPKGVRVVTLQTGGVPESLPESFPEKTRRAIAEDTESRTMLGRAATLADVGNAAVFAASDWSRALTATKLNVTCGAVPD